MKSFKLRKVILSGILAVSMLIASVGSTAYAGSGDTNAYKDIIEQNVKDVLSNGFSQYYTINSIKVRFDDVKVGEGNVEAKLLATMNTTLKAQKVEDLPYVKGMLKKVNLSDFSYESKAKTDEAVAKANDGKLNNEQLAKVSKNIDFRLSGLKQYINQAADNNFYLKVTADLSNDAIVQGSIKILAENLDIYVPVEKLLPRSSAEMEAEGSNDMQLVIEEQEQGYSPSLYANYNPSDARFYSSIYSTSPTDCYDHGTSCGIKQDREWWNNYAYNYYAELCHNDCADLVSQALSYGGIPEDDTWYATKYTSTRSLTWVNTGYLKDHMTRVMDYWRTTTYSSATEGAVMYTASNHVVMIAQNDTITHQYNGHTNDRYRANFSDSPSFVYYKLW